MWVRGVDGGSLLDKREWLMRFEKAVVFTLVFAIVYAVGVGCQKAGEKPQATKENQTRQMEATNQDWAGGPASTIEGEPGTATVQQATSDQSAVAEAAKAGDAGVGIQESAASEDDEGISLGRMVGGVFRAARSVVPLPVSASPDRRTEPDEQAPAFPQQ